MITYKRLHELLDYVPFTGYFYWKISKQGITKDLAGTINKRGYTSIGIDGKYYYAHRLAWFWVYGYMPENGIDHIKKIKYFNRIRNLREVSVQCNNRNCGNFAHNVSGVKGVSWAKNENKWRANIKINSKSKHLGNYFDFDNAVCARLMAEQCVDWEGCDSSSPAFKYVKNNIIGECHV